jgi:Histidine kinase-, DNA gyrase B-, and HSP90-like ATPase
VKPLESTIISRSTVDGETRAMSLDHSAIAHIIGVLTDLYADPIGAVVREYSTNALDATIEAGSSAPIRVTIPTQLSPFFVVQDFGIGMSVDTILDRYSMYGHSTKRDTNDQVGMLGLGCKSALTYSNSFSVISVHDGVQTTALVSKSDSGVGEIQIFDTVTTDEPNGTTIKVPVRTTDLEAFDLAIGQFFEVWDESQYQIIGETIWKSAYDWNEIVVSGYRVQWRSQQSYGRNKVSVVMGNVCYPYSGVTDIQNKNVQIRIFANIGDVAFAPSRESLMDNRKTQDFVTSMTKDFLACIEKSTQDQIDACKTAADAYSIYADFIRGFYSYGQRYDFTYLGTPLQIRFSIDSPFIRIENYNRTRTGKSTSVSIGADFANKIPVMIRGYKPKSLPKHLREWIWEQRSVPDSVFYNFTHVYITHEAECEWVKWVEWSDIAKDAPPAPRVTRLSGPSKISKNSGKRIFHWPATADDLGDVVTDTSKTYLMVTPEGDYALYIRDAESLGVVPVYVYQRDLKTFAQQFKTINDNISGYINSRTVDLQTDEWLWGYAFENVFPLGYLPPSLADKVLDPDLQKGLNARLAKDNTISSLRLSPKYSAIRDEVEKVSERYQALRSMSEDDMLEYVNALYSYRQEGK